MADEANPSTTATNDEGATPAASGPPDDPAQPAASEAPADTEGEQSHADETKPGDSKPAEAPAEGERPKDDGQPDEPAADDPKEQARRGFAERQRLKAQAQTALRQQLRPQTEEELMQQGYDEKDAEIEALRQRVEFGEFVNNVSDLTANLNMDAAQIEQEFDIFNENSPNFDKDFADKVSREYIRDAQVQFDSSGQYVLSARIPMYDYYKSRYDDRMAGQKAGQVSGQRAAERMLASAETPSSAAPPPPPAEDPVTKGLNEVFGG